MKRNRKSMQRKSLVDLHCKQRKLERLPLRKSWYLELEKKIGGFRRDIFSVMHKDKKTLQA